MATKSASGNGNNTLKILLFAIVLIAISVGTTLFLKDRIQFNTANADTAGSSQPMVVPDPLFTSLEPFTVSLRDRDGSRVVYVGITLRIDDEASGRMLTTYMPEVRDRVLATLTGQSTLQIQAPNGREILADQLLRELSKPYQPNPLGPRISRVLFTAFVVQ